MSPQKIDETKHTPRSLNLVCAGQNLRSFVNVMLWLRLQSLSRSVLSIWNYEEGFLKNVMSCDIEPGVAPQPVFLCLQLLLLKGVQWICGAVQEAKAGNVWMPMEMLMNDTKG